MYDVKNDNKQRKGGREWEGWRWVTIFTKSTKDSLKRDIGKRGGMCLTCSRNGKELLMGMENGATPMQGNVTIYNKIKYVFSL